MNDVELITGNCLDVLATMRAGSYDAVVTSPPYLDARHDYPTLAPHDWGELFDELRRVVDGPMLLNVGRIFRNNREVPWHAELVEVAHLEGWDHVDTLIWAKVNANPIQGPVLSNAHEVVLLFGRPSQFDPEAVRQPYAPGSVERLRRRWVSHIAVKGDTRDDMPSRRNRSSSAGMRLRENPNGARASSVFVCETGREKGNPHPAPMALELADHLVRLSGGQRILDPFGGSGTTALAARMNGRACTLVEVDPSYVDVARRRLSQPRSWRDLRRPAAHVQSTLFDEASP